MIKKKSYEEILKDYSKYKKSSDSLSVDTSGAGSYVGGQIDSYSNRLKANGIDPESITDTRNPLEKALKLTENQNALFDVFELINRPQQALFGAIDSAQKGENILSGGLQGFAGDKDTSGGQLLRNAGFGDDDNGEAELLKPSTWGVDDVLGTVLDIALDPADLIGIGVGGKVAKAVGKNSKAVKTVSKHLDDLVDAGRLTDGVGEVIATKGDDLVKDVIDGRVLLQPDLDGVAKGAKATNVLENLNLSDDVMNTLKTGRDTTTLTDATFKGGVAGIKKGASEADKFLLKNLKKIDDRAQSVGAISNKTAIYNDVKAALRSTFDSAARVPGQVLQKFAKDNGIATSTAYKLEGITHKMNEDLNKASEVLGVPVEEVDKLATRLVSQNQVDNLPNKITLSDIITQQSSDKLEFVSIPASYKTTNGKSLENVLKGSLKGNEKYLDNIMEKKDGYLVFNENGKKFLMDLQKDGDLGGLAGEEFTNIFTSKNIKQQAKLLSSKKNKDSLTSFDNLILNKSKQLDADNALRAKHPEVAKLVDENYMNQIKQTVDSDTGLNLKSIDGEGYDNKEYMHRKQSEAMDMFRKEAPLSKEGNLNIYDPSLKSISGLQTSKYTPVDVYNQMSRDIVSDLDSKAISPELKKAIYSGKLEEALSANVIDFANKYGSNSKNANVIDHVLAQPLINTSAPMYDLLDQKSNGLKKVNKLNDALNLKLQGRDAGELLNEAGLPKNLDVSSIKQEIQKASSFVDDIDKKQLPELMKDSLVIPDKVMSKLSKKYESIPGYTRVDTSILQGKLERLLKYDGVGASTEDINKLISQFGNNSYYSNYAYVDSRLTNMLNMVDAKPAQEMFSTVLNIVDNANGLFKRGKLLSPAYNIRNVIGGATNMMLAGIPASKIKSSYDYGIKITKEAKEAVEMIKKGVDLSDLPDNLSNAYTKYSEFLNYGFGEQTATKLYGLEDLTKNNATSVLPGVLGEGEKAVKKINDLNASLNSFMDNASRLGIMKYYEDNPDELFKLGVDNVGDAIRKIAFDPDDLSKAESTTLRKLIPFYTFAKKNLAFQLDNLPNNPKKYYRLQKATDSIWESNGVSKDDLEDYQRNGTTVPLPFITGGDLTYFKLNLPSSDLYEWTSDPLGRLMSSTSPVLKGGYEAVTGKNVFTGNDIENYEGEKATNSFGDLPLGLGTKKNEWALGLLGLDTPIRSAVGATNLVTSADKKGAISDFLGITGSKNVEKFGLSQQYDDLEKLKDFVSKAKQEGNAIPTLSELAKQENANTMESKYKAKIEALLNK